MDGGNTNGATDRVYVVECGKKEQIVTGSASVGKTHTVKVDVFSFNDPQCKRNAIHSYGPVKFEVKPGYTTRIKANRPSPLNKLKLVVSYEKN